ncbi:hypothetical protein [Pseudokordiimonas caeni]|uniref:hypothetical protein n=1 Tax=Pseudokordiimonas caeni TaxID=2997908 RepID=UPI002811E71E|nr:hypothetical protein [Pseudokordiimonas caeni]
MKLTYSIAVAFGFALTSLGALPVITPAAMAQAASASMEERQLQAQLIALAQSGNTAAIQQLVGSKIAQGKGAMVASVVKAIATMGQNLATVDPSGSVALISMAVTLASDPALASAFASADPTLSDAVGAAAANAAYAMTNTNPESAARIQTLVASINNGPLQMAYVNANVGGGSNTQTVQTAQNTQQTVARVVRVVTQPRPNTSAVPVVPEPNPDQSGSPT